MDGEVCARLVAGRQSSTSSSAVATFGPVGRRLSHPHPVTTIEHAGMMRLMEHGEFAWSKQSNQVGLNITSRRGVRPQRLTGGRSTSETTSGTSP